MKNTLSHRALPPIPTPRMRWVSLPFPVVCAAADSIVAARPWQRRTAQLLPFRRPEKKQ